MPDCVFCAIVARQAPARIVLEMPDVLCFFPLQPEITAHTLIASRQHYSNMTDALRR